MTLAYSYIRFSSAEQAKGDSFQRQIELRDAYIAEHDLTLDDSLKLEDLGVSAFKGKNADYGRLSLFLEAAKAGRIPTGSFFLVESLDRLSRAEVLDAFDLFRSIIKLGITIVTLSDRRVYSEESISNNFTELVVSIAVMSRAHEESKMKSERITKAWNKKREAAITTGKVMTKQLPFWIEKTENGLKVIEKQADIVRKIFQLSADGVGAMSICRILNNAGDLTVKGKLWLRGNVSSLLNKRSVIGEANFQKLDPIPNYFPPIIDEALFYQVQDRLKSHTVISGNGKVSDYKNLFRKLVKCPYCGGPMSYRGKFHNAKGKDIRRIHAYLFCVHNSTKGGCRAKIWDYFEFQHLFLNYVKELDVSVLVNSERKDGEIKQVKDQIAKERLLKEQLTSKLNNLVAVIEGGGFSTAIVERIASLERDVAETSLSIEESESRLGQLSFHSVSAEATKDNMRKLIDLLKDSPRNPSLEQEMTEEVVTRRAKLSVLIASIVEKIDVYTVGAHPTIADKIYRFMVITFKSGAVRGLAWDGTSVTMDDTEDTRTWTNWKNGEAESRITFSKEKISLQ